MVGPDDIDISAYALPSEGGNDGYLPDREGGSIYGDGLPWSNETVADQLWQRLTAEQDF